MSTKRVQTSIPHHQTPHSSLGLSGQPKSFRRPLSQSPTLVSRTGGSAEGKRLSDGVGVLACEVG